MEAGPQLDSTVARAVWKYIIVVDTQTGEHFLVGRDHQKTALPKFSTVITDAYKLAEHFQTLGYALVVRSQIAHGDATYLAAFTTDGQDYQFSEGPTLPYAICAAALAVCQGTHVAK